PTAFLGDMQKVLGNSTYSLKLTDQISSSCGSYTVADTPEQNFSAQSGRNTLTFVVAPGGNPKIPQGRALDITLPWQDTPQNGTWEILLNQSVKASSSNPNGWNVQPLGLLDEAFTD